MPDVKLTGFSSTFVKTGNSAGQNLYGGYSYSAVGWYGGDQAGYTRTYIQNTNNTQWDNIPNGAVIRKATMSMSVQRDYMDKPEAYNVLLPSSGWSAGGITWNNQPSGTYSNGQTSFTARGKNDTVSFDVTDWVKNAVNNSGYRSSGVTIRQQDPNNDTRNNRTDFNRDVSVTVTYDLPKMPNPSLEIKGNFVRIFGDDAGDATSVNVQKSTDGPNGAYSNVPGVDVNGRNYTVLDKDKVARPTRTSFTSAEFDGTTIKLKWAKSTQAKETRHYKARKNYKSGGQSQFSNSVSIDIEPTISRYIVTRRLPDSDNPNKSHDVYTGGNLFYDDTMPLDQNVIYEVVAENSQGGQSVMSTIERRINRWKAPAITSVTVNGNNKNYVLNGSGVENRSEIIVLWSPNNKDDSYKELQRFYSNGRTFSQELEFFNPPSPDPPTFTSINSAEDVITLTWKGSNNKSLKTYFKILYVHEKIPSKQSTPKMGTLTPTTTGYSLTRTGGGAGKKQHLTNANQTSFSDSTDLPKGAELEYILTQHDNIGNSSNLKATSITTRPLAPTIYAPTPSPVLIDAVTGDALENGKQRVLIEGFGRNGANPIKFERDGGDGWKQLSKNASYPATVVPPRNVDFFLRDDPPLQAARATVISNIKADNEGAHLAWSTPRNPANKYTYRASRFVQNLNYAGYPSNELSINIVPTVAYWIIERRLSPPRGKEGDEEYAWSDVSDPFLYLNSPTTLKFTDDHLAVQANFGKTYDYRIFSVNDWGITSPPSDPFTVKAIDVPADLDEEVEEPPKPKISNAFPTGSIQLNSGTEDFRFTWQYDDNSVKNDYPQVSYSLKVTYTDVTEKVQQWDAAQKKWVDYGVNDEPIYNSSSEQRVDVGVSPFRTAVLYDFELEVYSKSGVKSDTLGWSVEPSIFSTTNFDTRREVIGYVESSFDTHRQIRSFSNDGGEYGVGVSWYVQESLPMTVDDGLWEGGGNSWIWTVLDNNGRPEPKAKIDFEKPGYKKTFASDPNNRGRFVLNIPEDLEPGVYTFRERGESMAPRTTYNVPVYDPWLIYQHGHRHNADGPDPITGLTRDQFSERANFKPSQIEGGESIASIVNEYGTDIRAGLERHVSAGHGNFIVTGFDYSINGADFFVTGGSCWEGGRRRDVAAQNFQLASTDGGFPYQMYVQNGLIQFSRRADAPPDSCPLFSVTVTSSGVINQPTVLKLFHPPFGNTINQMTPVRWGASSTADIIHNDKTLDTVISESVAELDNRRNQEALLQGQFNDKVRAVDRKIAGEETERLIVRKTALQLGFASNLRYMYSIFRTQNLSPPTNPKYPQFTNPNASMCAFKDGDEISSLSTIQLPRVNATTGFTETEYATLPRDWTPGFRYVLRSLRIPVPMSYMLQLAIIYEDVPGQQFEVRGALGLNEVFILDSMNEVYTIEDKLTMEKLVAETPGAKDASGVQPITRQIRSIEKTLRINVYQVEFRNPGDEAIIEANIIGGNGTDGARIYGYFVNSA